MNKHNNIEVWKDIELNVEFGDANRIQVSSFGRIRTFNAVSDGNILKGSMINGYRIIRSKFYSPRDEKSQDAFDALQKQVLKFTKKVKELKQGEAPKIQVDEATELLKTFKKKVSKKFADDLKKRTINHQFLVHKAVAEHFCKPASKEHTVVGHLDYNKLNNHYSNLKWMTKEENYKHQQNSPYVIAINGNKLIGTTRKPTNNKLTITKVMLLKKLLNKGKPMRTLIKQFKITETQILRIKRGENWTYIEAAT